MLSEHSRVKNSNRPPVVFAPLIRLEKVDLDVFTRFALPYCLK